MRVCACMRVCIYVVRVHRQIRDEILAELEKDMRKRRAAKQKLVHDLEGLMGREQHNQQPADESEKNNIDGRRTNDADEKETIRLVRLPSTVGVVRRIKRKRRERRLRDSSAVSSTSLGRDHTDHDTTIDCEKEEMDEDESLQHLGRKEHIQLLHLGDFWAQLRIVLDIAGAVFFMIGVIDYLIGTVREHACVCLCCVFLLPAVFIGAAVDT